MKEKINTGVALFIKNNFILFFSFYFVAMFLETTTIDRNFENLKFITSVIKIVAYIMFFGRLILIIPDYKEKIKKFRKNNYKYYLLIVVAVLTLFLSLILTFIYTGNKKYIMIFLILISSYGTSFFKITKRLEKLQILCTTILVLFSMFGFVDNYVIYREDGLARNSLGFGYVTNLSQMIMCAIILHLFNLKFYEKKINLLYLQLVNICIYFITNSKTEFIIVELVLLSTCIYNIEYLKKYCIAYGKKILSVFCKIFWALPIISLVLVVTYTSNPVSGYIDKVLANRIKYPYSVIEEYGFSIFGKDIEFIGNGIKDRQKYPNKQSNYVDNEYLQCLFTNGVIFFILEILILSIYLYLLKKNKEYKSLFLSMIFLTFALLNPRLKELIYCPILFLVVKALVDKNQKEYAD